MFQKVDPLPDFVALEHEALRHWKASNAFDLLREKTRGGEAWSFIDGPITANNPMGVHHAWGRTYKDCFQRFFAMCGRELRWQGGFDCQGLWVELEVEKELGLKTKHDIESFGVENFTEACKARVRKYAGIQQEQSRRLGFWMDWDDSYFTMSDRNNYTIWRFLKECHERGFIYKGTDVMPWSGRAASAYSDMEVKEGHRLAVHTSVFVRLPIRGRENEYLLVWTTTPWTLTSNSGCAINGELDYVKVRSDKDGAAYWLAKENLASPRMAKEFKEGFPPFGPWPKDVPKLKTLEQLFKEQGGGTVEETVKGAELVGLTYDGPFDELPAQQRTGGFAEDLSLIPEEQREWLSGAEGHRVFDAGRDSRGNPYVIAGEGTGIVHCAPGCGDVDHVWGKEHRLATIAPLAADGTYIDGFGPFVGMNPTDPATTDALIASLEEKGLLFASERYPHIYPHCWRTGDQLVYRLVDEWFISMEWREEIMRTVEGVQWLPPDMHGAERELDWLRTMRDWMISKKRVWGLALPIWECSSCSNFDVIGGREELEERAVEGWDAFDGNSPHRPWIDGVKIACSQCGATASRIPDVGNPWLDAGIVAYSTTRFDEDRAYWERWVPADFITECFPGQFRNWFYSLLAMSTMMETVRGDEAAAKGEAFERRPPFKTLLGHAMVLNEHRQAMHKSDGTAIWFEEAAEQIGVDTMRWMYCRQKPTEELAFGLRHPGDEVTVQVGDESFTHTVDGVRFCKVTSTPADETRRKVLLTLWNSYSFFSNYARIDGFDANTPEVPIGERPDIDRWILSDLQLLVEEARAGFEGFRTDLVCKSTEAFLDALSNWYIRRNRKRFWRGSGEGDASAQRDKLAAHQTLYEVLRTLDKLIAPILPFLSEAMHANLVRDQRADAPASVHLEDYPTPDESRIDRELSQQMNAVIRAVSLGRSVRGQEKVGVRQPLAEAVLVPANAGERAAFERFRAHVLEELNIKQLSIQDEADFLTWELKPDFKKLGPKLGKRMKALPKTLKALDVPTIASKLGAGVSVDVEVEGESVEIAPDELHVLPVVPEGRAAAYDRGTVLALDLVLTPELEQEGFAREVLRRLQDLRKQTGLEMEDRIRLRIATDDAELEAALDSFADMLERELLAVDVGRSLEPGDAHTIEVRKDPPLACRVQIEKAATATT